MKTPPVCDYEGSDYQENFWEQGNRAYEDAAEEIALKRLLPSGSGHLLELGAGAGRKDLAKARHVLNEETPQIFVLETARRQCVVNVGL